MLEFNQFKSRFYFMSGQKRGFFVASLVLLLGSTQTQARTLNCKLKDTNNADALLAEASISLDVKPNPKDPYPYNGLGYTDQIVRTYPVIGGKSGKLYTRISASWYERYHNYDGATNTDQKFPQVDLMAFFYEKMPDGSGYAGPYSQIAVRTQGTPTLGVHNMHEDVWGMWVLGQGAKFECVVDFEK